MCIRDRCVHGGRAHDKNRHIIPARVIAGVQRVKAGIQHRHQRHDKARPQNGRIGAFFARAHVGKHACRPHHGQIGRHAGVLDDTVGEDIGPVSYTHLALGHFCTLGYLLSAGVSKLTGNVSKSTEDVKFPAKLSFLQDTYLAVGSVMVPLYVLMAILAGPEVVAEAAGDKNYIVYAVLQGITFCVGLFLSLIHI